MKFLYYVLVASLAAFVTGWYYETTPNQKFVTRTVKVPVEITTTVFRTNVVEASLDAETIRILTVIGQIAVFNFPTVSNEKRTSLCIKEAAFVLEFAKTNRVPSLHFQPFKWVTPDMLQ